MDNENRCVTCGKTFKYKATLARHKKEVHGNQKAFCCPHCEKCFRRLYMLKRHVDVVHGIDSAAQLLEENKRDEEDVEDGDISSSDDERRYMLTDDEGSDDNGDDSVEDDKNEGSGNVSSKQGTLDISGKKEKCDLCGCFYKNKNSLKQHQRHSHGIYVKKTQESTLKKATANESDEFELTLPRQNTVFYTPQPSVSADITKEILSSSAPSNFNKKSPDPTERKENLSVTTIYNRSDGYAERKVSISPPKRDTKQMYDVNKYKMKLTFDRNLIKEPGKYQMSSKYGMVTGKSESSSNVKNAKDSSSAVVVVDTQSNTFRFDTAFMQDNESHPSSPEYGVVAIQTKEPMLSSGRSKTQHLCDEKGDASVFSQKITSKDTLEVFQMDYREDDKSMKSFRSTDRRSKSQQKKLITSNKLKSSSVKKAKAVCLKMAKAGTEKRHKKSKGEIPKTSSTSTYVPVPPPIDFVVSDDRDTSKVLVEDGKASVMDDTHVSCPGKSVSSALSSHIKPSKKIRKVLPESELKLRLDLSSNCSSAEDNSDTASVPLEDSTTCGLDEMYASSSPEKSAPSLLPTCVKPVRKKRKPQPKSKKLKANRSNKQSTTTVSVQYINTLKKKREKLERAAKCLKNSWMETSPVKGKTLLPSSEQIIQPDEANTSVENTRASVSEYTTMPQREQQQKVSLDISETTMLSEPLQPARESSENLSLKDWKISNPPSTPKADSPLLKRFGFVNCNIPEEFLADKKLLTDPRVKLNRTHEQTVPKMGTDSASADHPRSEVPGIGDEIDGCDDTVKRPSSTSGCGAVYEEAVANCKSDLGRETNLLMEGQHVDRMDVDLQEMVVPSKEQTAEKESLALPQTASVSASVRAPVCAPVTAPDSTPVSAPGSASLVKKTSPEASKRNSLQSGFQQCFIEAALKEAQSRTVDMEERGNGTVASDGQVNIRSPPIQVVPVNESIDVTQSQNMLSTNLDVESKVLKDKEMFGDKEKCPSLDSAPRKRTLCQYTQHLLDQKKVDYIHVLKSFMPLIKHMKGISVKKVKKKKEIDKDKNMVLEVLDFRTKTNHKISDLQTNSISPDSIHSSNSNTLHEEVQASEDNITNTLTLGEETEAAIEADAEKPEMQTADEGIQIQNLSPTKKSPRKSRKIKSKQFSCTYCELSFYRQSSLESHLVSSHPSDDNTCAKENSVQMDVEVQTPSEHVVSCPEIGAENIDVAVDDSSGVISHYVTDSKDDLPTDKEQLLYSPTDTRDSDLEVCENAKVVGEERSVSDTIIEEPSLGKTQPSITEGDISIDDAPATFNCSNNDDFCNEVVVDSVPEEQEYTESVTTEKPEASGTNVTMEFIMERVKEIQPALQMYACQQILGRSTVNLKYFQPGARRQQVDNIVCKRIKEKVWLVQDTSVGTARSGAEPVTVNTNLNISSSQIDLSDEKSQPESRGVFIGQDLQKEGVVSAAHGSGQFHSDPITVLCGDYVVTFNNETQQNNSAVKKTSESKVSTGKVAAKRRKSPLKYKSEKLQRKPDASRKGQSHHSKSCPGCGPDDSLTDFERALNVGEKNRDHKKSNKKSFKRQLSSESHDSGRKEHEVWGERVLSVEEMKQHAEEQKAAPQSRLVQKILREKALEEQQRENNLYPVVTALPTFTEILRSSEASKKERKKLATSNVSVQSKTCKDQGCTRGNEQCLEGEGSFDAFDDIATEPDLDEVLKDVNMLYEEELFKDGMLGNDNDATEENRLGGRVASSTDNLPAVTGSAPYSKVVVESVALKPMAGVSRHDATISYDPSSVLDQIYGPKKGFSRSFRKVGTIEKDPDQFRSPIQFRSPLTGDDISNHPSKKITLKRLPAPATSVKLAPDWDKLRQMLENSMAQSMIPRSSTGNTESFLQRQAESNAQVNDDTLTAASVFGADPSDSKETPKFSFFTRPSAETEVCSSADYNVDKDSDALIQETIVPENTMKESSIAESSEGMDVGPEEAIPHHDMVDPSDVKRVPQSVVKKSIPDSTTFDFTSSPIKVQVFTGDKSTKRLVTMPSAVGEEEQMSGAVSSSGFSATSRSSTESEEVTPSMSQTTTEAVDAGDDKQLVSEEQRSSSKTADDDNTATGELASPNSPRDENQASPGERADVTEENLNSGGKCDSRNGDEGVQDSKSKDDTECSRKSPISEKQSEDSDQEMDSSDDSDSSSSEEEKESDSSSDEEEEEEVEDDKTKESQDVDEIQLFAESDDDFLGVDDDVQSTHSEEIKEERCEDDAGRDKVGEVDMEVDEDSKPSNEAPSLQEKESIPVPVQRNSTPGPDNHMDNFSDQSAYSQTFPLPGRPYSMDVQSQHQNLDILQNANFMRKAVQLNVVPRGYCFYYIKNKECKIPTCTYKHVLPHKEELYSQGLRRIMELHSAAMSSHTSALLAEKEKAFEIFRLLQKLDMVIPPETLRQLLDLAYSTSDADSAFDLFGHLTMTGLINRETCCQLISLCCVYPLRYKEQLWQLFECLSQLNIPLTQQCYNILLRTFQGQCEWFRLLEVMTYGNVVQLETPAAVVDTSLRSLKEDAMQLIPCAVKWLYSCNQNLVSKLDSQLVDEVVRLMQEYGHSDAADSLLTMTAGSDSPTLGHTMDDENSQDAINYYDNGVSSSEDVKSIINRLKGSFISRNLEYMAEIFIEISSTQDCSDKCYLKALVEGFVTYQSLGPEIFLSAIDNFFTEVDIAFHKAKQEDVLARKDWRLLGSLGNHLIRACQECNWLEICLRLIRSLVQHNIHYYKFNPPGKTDIDVVTIEICLQLEALPTALQILEGNEWHCLRSTNQSPDAYNHTMEMLKVFMSHLLEQRFPGEVSRILLQLLKMKSEGNAQINFTVIDFNAYFSSVIQCALDISDACLAYRTYNIYESCITERALPIGLLRGILYACGNSGNTNLMEVAKDLFRKLMSENIYPAQKIDTSPRIIVIKTSMTLMEVKLLILDYLPWLYNHLCGKLSEEKSKYLSDQDLSLGIKIVLSNMEPLEIPYGCMTPRTVLAMRNAILTLLEEEFKPPFLVANKAMVPTSQQEFICRILPRSLLNNLQEFDKKNKKHYMLLPPEASNQRPQTWSKTGGIQRKFVTQ